mmetsp:Transcript_101606/g.191216  ORF Transcript_101606/g.191216 Transcript_101606/m.191216 type:complete len:240 (-) Transcript_101606:262-981(-)
MPMLKVNDRNIWCCQKPGDTVRLLELQVANRPCPSNYWISSQCLSSYRILSVVLFILVVVAIRVPESVCSHLLGGLAVAHAHNTGHVAHTCDHQPPTRDECYCSATAVRACAMLLSEFHVEFLEAFAHDCSEPVVLPITSESRKLRQQLLVDLLRTEVCTNVCSTRRTARCTVMTLVKSIKCTRAVKVVNWHAQRLSSFCQVVHDHVLDLHSLLMEARAHSKPHLGHVSLVELCVLLRH